MFIYRFWVYIFIDISLITLVYIIALFVRLALSCRPNIVVDFKIKLCTITGPFGHLLRRGYWISIAIYYVRNAGTVTGADPKKQFASCYIAYFLYFEWTRLCKYCLLCLAARLPCWLGFIIGWNSSRLSAASLRSPWSCLTEGKQLVIVQFQTSPCTAIGSILFASTFIAQFPWCCSGMRSWCETLLQHRLW